MGNASGNYSNATRVPSTPLHTAVQYMHDRGCEILSVSHLCLPEPRTAPYAVAAAVAIPGWVEALRCTGTQRLDGCTSKGAHLTSSTACSIPGYTYADARM